LSAPEHRALLTSPFCRAPQTAAILRLALPVTAVRKEPNLCDLLPGQADGLTWETYRAQYSLFDLVAEPERPFAPDAESWLEFHGRVPRTMATLAEQFAGRTVAAVTHGGSSSSSYWLSLISPAPAQAPTCT
jgi:broad specificity phosphatase PhoE